MSAGLKSVHRFFIPLREEVTTFPAEVSVTQADTVHHLRQVIRMKAGDALITVDGMREIAYVAEILSLDKQQARLRLSEPLPAWASTMPFITLGVALIKEQRWDWLLQKATELGVRRIIPLQSERCVVQVRDADKKVARWQAVVQNAAEQSEGLFVPEVTAPMSLREFALHVEEMPLRLLLAERGDRPSLRSLLLSPAAGPLVPTPPYRRIAAAIGPEGGWTPEELGYFALAGFQPVSLGQRILRSETAAIALMSALSVAYDG